MVKRKAEQQQKQEAREGQSSLMRRRKRLHCKGSRSSKEEKNFDSSNAINPPPWAGHAKLKQIVPLAFEENEGEGREPEQQQKFNALDVFRHQRGSSLDGLEFLCPSYQWLSKNINADLFTLDHKCFIRLITIVICLCNRCICNASSLPNSFHFRVYCSISPEHLNGHFRDYTSNSEVIMDVKVYLTFELKTKE